MKKQIIAVALVSSMVVATVASANWNRGGGRGFNGDCPCAQGQYQTQLDPEIQEKLDLYFDDTQELRKQITVKKAEQRALMRGENPDPAVAAKLAGELFDLRMVMRDKAEAAGVEDYIGRNKRGGGPRKMKGGNRGGQGGRFIQGGPQS